MGQRSLRDAYLTIKDGSTTPNSCKIKIGEGNITWSEKRNVEYTHDRGSVDEVRLGDDEPCEVSFDFIWDWISSISGVSPSEAIKCTASGWKSTGGECEPPAVNLIIEMYGCLGDSLMETITFADFRYESLDYDLRAGSIKCSGRIPDIGPSVS